MPDDRSEIDIDFEGQMKLLASEAEANSDPGSPPAKSNAPGLPGSAGLAFPRVVDRKELSLLLEQFIRPLALELGKIKTDNENQGALITALGKAINVQHGMPATMESMLAEMRRLQSIESANQKLFDALHGELKSYKDGFLFDALQKPFIRDLVSLFDDLSEMHAQIERRLEAPAHGEQPVFEGGEPRKNGKDSDDRTFLRTLAGNMENQIAHMVEVFLRMDVILSRTCAGAPLDKKNHRTVAFEPAAHPDEDSQVARSVKPGFFWRERTVRPEEVVVRRWTPPVVPGAAETAPPPPAVHPVPITPRVRPRHDEEHS